MATSAAKDAERVRQDKRQFVKAASTLQIRDHSAKTKPVNYYKRLAEEHMVGKPSRTVVSLGSRSMLLIPYAHIL
eukprot:6986327-Pyramimonas_sp.AAC.1